jgi:hypothetical protein
MMMEQQIQRRRDTADGVRVAIRETRDRLKSLGKELHHLKELQGLQGSSLKDE